MLDLRCDAARNAGMPYGRPDARWRDGNFSRARVKYSVASDHVLPMFRSIVVSFIVALSSVSVAQAQSRGEVLWTVAGAGAGFGVGLWAGLSAFDDAVNSDRKVWTSAIVSGGIGAVAGYLIGRSRTNHSHPSTTTSVIEREKEAAERPAPSLLPVTSWLSRCE